MANFAPAESYKVFLDTAFEGIRREHLLIVSLVASAACMALTFTHFDPIFFTNDDYRMRLIVAGNYSGTPTSENIFLGFFLSKMLASLYSLAPAIDWYGAFFLGALYISLSVIFYIILISSKDILSLFLSFFLLLGIFFLFLMIHFGLPQFTTLAALLGSALFLLIKEITHRSQGSSKPGKPILATTFLVFFLFINVRFNVFLIFGMYYLIYLGSVLAFNKALPSSSKAMLKKGIVIGLIFVSLMAVLNNVIVGNESKGFQEFNEARSSYYDHAYIDNYVDYEHFYRSIGVDRASFLVLLGRTFDVDPTLDAGTLTAIANHNREVLLSDIGVFGQAWSSFKNAGLSFINQNLVKYQFVYFSFLYVLLFYLSVRIKDKSSTSFLVLGAIFTLLFSTYLMFEGRIMDRINWSILLAFFMPALHSILQILANNQTIYRRLQASIILVILIVMSFTLAALQYGSFNKLHRHFEGVSKDLQITTEYTKDHPDNFYFLNALDYIGISQALFSPDEGLVNLDSLGNWYFKSPAYYERNARFGFTSALDGFVNTESVYYIDLGEYSNPMVDFLREDHGLEFYIVDSIAGETTSINIYQVRRPNAD